MMFFISKVSLFATDPGVDTSPFAGHGKIPRTAWTTTAREYQARGQMSNFPRPLNHGAGRIGKGPGKRVSGLAVGSMRALLLFVLLLGVAGPDAISATAHWQPPGIRPSDTTL